jgi:hypothetical protein
MQASNGGIILTGAAGSVGIVYAAAYVFHLDQIEQEKAAAEAKQAKAAEQRATLQTKKQAEQTAKDAVDTQEKADIQLQQAQVVAKAKEADDNRRVETTLKADEKEQAKKAEAGDSDDHEDKKAPRRLRFRFWKKE